MNRLQLLALQQEYPDVRIFLTSHSGVYLVHEQKRCVARRSHRSSIELDKALFACPGEHALWATYESCDFEIRMARIKERCEEL